jgi:hypothetical protein
MEKYSEKAKAGEDGRFPQGKKPHSSPEKQEKKKGRHPGSEAEPDQGGEGNLRDSGLD